MSKQYCNDGRCERTRKGEKHLVHDLNSQELTRNNSLNELIQVGSQLTGAGIGGTIGLAMGGTDGAITGSMIGTGIGRALNSVGNEIAKRFLSPREKSRLGAVLIYTSRKIQMNLDNGFNLREDNFFNGNLKERSSADEIAEGVLQAAQKDHEEKKLPFYGSLLANIAFSPIISREHANLLIKLFANLSYRQLCLLSIFGQNKTNSLRRQNYRSHANLNMALIALLQEVFELEQLGLIGSMTAVLSITDIIPNMTQLQGLGETLFELAELSTISMDELTTASQMLAN